MAKLSSCQGHYFNCPVVCIFFMLTACMLPGISAVDLPQRFSVREKGSTEATEYSCNSYEKQFSSIEEVSYKQMLQQSDPCQCIVSITSPPSVNGDATVFTVQLYSPVDVELSIPYSWFTGCDSTLRFNVASTRQQTGLDIYCDKNSYRHLSEVNMINPTVMTTSAAFTDSVSMECESQSVITTGEPSSTETATQGGSANNPTNAPPNDGSAVQDDASAGNGSSGGKTAGIVIGVLLALGVIAALVVLGIWWWRKKRQQEEPEHPAMNYKDSETPAKTVNVYENTGYGNETQNNNMKKGSTSSLSDRPVSYADIDPNSLKRADYPVRSPSVATDGSRSPTINYVELDWKKQSVF